MASLRENLALWSVDEESKALVGIRIALGPQSLPAMDHRPSMCLVQLYNPSTEI